MTMSSPLAAAGRQMEANPQTTFLTWQTSTLATPPYPSRPSARPPPQPIPGACLLLRCQLLIPHPPRQQQQTTIRGEAWRPLPQCRPHLNSRTTPGQQPPYSLRRQRHPGHPCPRLLGVRAQQPPPYQHVNIDTIFSP